MATAPVPVKQTTTLLPPHPITGGRSVLKWTGCSTGSPADSVYRSAALRRDADLEASHISVTVRDHNVTLQGQELVGAQPRRERRLVGARRYPGR
jgi:hypothetical protein